MSGPLSLSPYMTITPAQEGEVRLRLPQRRAELQTDPYFARLLEHFDAKAAPDGALIDEVIARFPFRKKESLAFLSRCRALGILEPTSAADSPTPSRIPAAQPLFGMPPFEAEAPAAFVFLGVPFDGAVTGLPGARFGPQSIRAAGEGVAYQVDVHSLRSVGFADLAQGRLLLEGVSLADAGDVFVPPAASLSEVFPRVTSAVSELLQVGSIPLVMGGDHAITHAILGAYADTPLQILHLDAHTDLGDFGPKRPLHHGNVMRAILAEHKDVARVVQVGLRGLLDVGAMEAVDGVRAIGVDRLRDEGDALVLNALDPQLPVYVSLDIDVLDPSVAPSTGTPVAGGLWLHEVKRLLRATAERFAVLGMDVVEVAGVWEPLDQTASAALSCLMTLADGVLNRLRHERTHEGE